ncbi:hypothetical protein [Amycolatopsis granulosa]|uniref:hypothetical protein n=1 Tax=Amycolatopsis granulosa TaxID=185684 RepID=UPI00141F4462|nr:hypothetical protein [Amycolatopsis granulosa]NIH83292.1 hypothetical protein [Amycolatopsis granulosa]
MSAVTVLRAFRRVRCPRCGGRRTELRVFGTRRDGRPGRRCRRDLRAAARRWRRDPRCAACRPATGAGRRPLQR